MIDPLSLAVGGGLLALGWLAGRFRRPARAPAPYTCTCLHPLSDHDKKTKACHARTFQRRTQTTHSRYVDCTCRQYVGDTPIDMSTLTFPTLPKSGGQ